jgi:DNA polymerase I-like protein with 3'-5' exonuclease and polymerase domains
MIRGLFLPEEGEKWGSFDYSSQEPRIVVHYASLMKLPGAGEFVARYIADKHSDFHQIAADIVGVPRKQAKTINLGLFYGMGITKLAAQLGLELSDAKDLFAKYHDEVPFVRGISEVASTRAGEFGSIRTLLGRKCRYDKWEPSMFGVHKPLSHEEAFATYGKGIRRAFTYKALNSLIQGSAADQTKKAMVLLAEEGILPMVQIHDELAVSVPDEATARRVQEIMETCVKLVVPSVVDAELGESWGSATKKIDDAWK